MAQSRELGRGLQLVAPTVARNFCRFCGREAINGRAFLDLQINKKIYAMVVKRLEYMNIKPAKKLNMIICKTCYGYFNTAFNFCLNFNITQIRLVNFYSSEEACPENKPLCVASKRVLDNIKIELDSADELDVENDDELFPTPNKRKKQIIDINKSWESYTWTCCHCDEEYTNLSELRSHSKREHGICFAFECPDCDIKLNEYDKFIEHVRDHKENLRFYCDICDSPIEYNGRHDHETGRAMCHHCGEILSNVSKMSRHQETYKTRVIAEEKTKSYIITVADLQLETVYPDCNIFQSWNDYVWRCSFCDIKFNSGNALREHSKKVHNSCFTMKCLDCDEVTELFPQLVIHIMRHRPSLRHFCPFCNRLAHSDDLFRKHIKDHLTNSSYCPECGQLYPDAVADIIEEVNTTSMFWFLESAQDNATGADVIETNQGTKPVKDSVEGSDEDTDEEPQENHYDGDDDDDTNDSEEEEEEEEAVHQEEEKKEKDTSNMNDNKKQLPERSDTANNDNKKLLTVPVNVNSDSSNHKLPCPKSCRKCNETYTDKRLYREHTNIRYCPICDETFHCIKSLDDHLFSSHMAAKPYECYKCGRCYCKRENAYNCMELHIGHDTKTCKICHSAVLSTFLKEHVMAHNYDVYPIEMACGYDYCTMTFPSWIERVNHRYAKHLAISYRKISDCRRYNTQKNLLNWLPIKN